MDGDKWTVTGKDLPIRIFLKGQVQCLLCSCTHMYILSLHHFSPTPSFFHSFTPSLLHSITRSLTEQEMKTVSVGADVSFLQQEAEAAEPASKKAKEQ